MQRVTEIPPPPGRPEKSHKGTFGRVLIVAGSRGMSGAAALAGAGALRGGAGLVTLAVPEGLLPVVASIEPSYLTAPLPQDAQGRISLAARQRLAEIIPANTVVAFGCGCGQSDELVELAQWMMSTVRWPVVVDADGINVLSRIVGVLPQSPGPRVLTPHPGEFARLLGGDSGAVQKDREGLAFRFAAENDVVLVLKGHGTVVTDGERLAVNETGNSGMATGGTGDVLTGLIAALLAQGMPPFEAARLGVHLHGLTGDLAAEECGLHALIASDLPQFLGAAFQQMIEEGNEQ